MKTDTKELLVENGFEKRIARILKQELSVNMTLIKRGVLEGLREEKSFTLEEDNVAFLPDDAYEGGACESQAMNLTCFKCICRAVQVKILKLERDG